MKKVLDLDHTRGIVMGATCDIDQMVRECIEAMHELSDATGKKKLLTGMSEFVTEEIEKLKAIAEKLEGATNIEPFFNAHLLFTSYHRLRILSRLLKESRFSAYSEYRTTVVKYLDQKEGVVRGRNLLGHVVLIPEGSPKAISVGKGQTISVEKARELRKKILEARTKFRQLREGLQSATSKVSAPAASPSIPVRSE